MIHGDRDDVVFARHVRAVVHGVAAVAASESAAMEPEHDGTLARVQSVGPDVEMQAILADGSFGNSGGHFRNFGVRTLRRFGTPLDGLLYAGPDFGLSGRHEPVRTAGGRAVGNAAEGVDLIFRCAADLAGGGVGNGALHGTVF